MAPEPSWWSCENLTGNQSNEFGKVELGRLGSKYSTESKQSHQGGKIHQQESQNSSMRAIGGEKTYLISLLWAKVKVLQF